MASIFNEKRADKFDVSVPALLCSRRYTKGKDIPTGEIKTSFGESDSIKIYSQ